ncbi:hypothetical protein MHU86_1665 [Fragilaria crotonensis]|nr:hypothetical protein MHU86_1665 [Fragilaria crotonensis]
MTPNRSAAPKGRPVQKGSGSGLRATWCKTEASKDIVGIDANHTEIEMAREVSDGEEDEANITVCNDDVLLGSHHAKHPGNIRFRDALAILNQKSRRQKRPTLLQ